MPLDITAFDGVSKWEPQTIDYPANDRNDFRYSITFEKMVYDAKYRIMTGFFGVQRHIQHLGEWRQDISYVYASVANDTTFVDKFGNYVAEDSEDKWGTEFERMQVLFSTPIADSSIVSGYQDELYNKGLFDFPKQ